MQDATGNKLRNQRVFQHPDGRYILLTKAGKAVCFWVDPQNKIHISQELDGVDFKATGTQLKKEGWKCIGPGLEFDKLLDPEA